jgi:hypothetical protein
MSHLITIGLLGLSILSSVAAEKFCGNEFFPDDDIIIDSGGSGDEAAGPAAQATVIDTFFHITSTEAAAAEGLAPI